MELRKDYLLNRWVIIAEGRAKRPMETVARNIASSTAAECPLCPGNEAMTPPESYRVEEQGKWKIRVVPNKFSAVDPKGDPNLQTHNRYYTFAGDHGEHEMVIETPDHNKLFGDLSADEIVKVMQVYSNRIKALYKDSADRYVCVFKNQGREAGASLQHSHSQIISMAMMPPEVADKIEATKRFSYCPYCEIISKEKNSYRRCFENDSCISFAPYASRFNYEAVLFPKEHIRTFDDFSEKTYYDMALMLKQLVSRLEKVGIPYDLAWYYAPAGEQLHFHVEVMPRLALWAGLEVGFGITVNIVSPENAAKFYRGEA